MMVERRERNLQLLLHDETLKKRNQEETITPRHLEVAHLWVIVPNLLLLGKKGTIHNQRDTTRSTLHLVVQMAHQLFLEVHIKHITKEEGTR